MDILPDLFCEDEVVARFKSSGLNLRTLRRCARAKGVGRKFSRHWFFTEPEILELMKGAKATCSNSQNGGARQASTRAGHTSASAFSKALELATEGKPKGFSPRCKTASSKGRRVVAFSPSRGS